MPAQSKTEKGTDKNDGATPMRNTRNEKFAQLVATGAVLEEAYVASGYATTRARQASDRLRKREDVAARILYLQEMSAVSLSQAFVFNRQWVLEKLKMIFEDAYEDREYSPSIRALELIGKELSMFADRVDTTLRWDGDPAKLDDRAAARLTEYLERLAYGDDAAAIKAERDQHLLSQGLLIEAPVPDEPQNVKRANNESVVSPGAVHEAREAQTDHISHPGKMMLRRSWAQVSDKAERARLAEEWMAKGPALPDGLAKEERVAWLDAHWPLDDEY